MMFLDYSRYRFCIQPGYTDMRSGELSLAARIQEQMHLDPFDRIVFLFCGTAGRRIKAIVWDGNGFWLMTKRLEKGTFRWPMDGKEALGIRKDDVVRMLRGEDVFRRLETLDKGIIF